MWLFYDSELLYENPYHQGNDVGFRVVRTAKSGLFTKGASCVLLLQKKPSPDWKGAERVAVRQWRRKPEPCKAGIAKEADRDGVPGTVKIAICSRNV